MCLCVCAGRSWRLDVSRLDLWWALVLFSMRDTKLFETPPLSHSPFKSVYNPRRRNMMNCILSVLTSRQTHESRDNRQSLTKKGHHSVHHFAQRRLHLKAAPRSPQSSLHMLQHIDTQHTPIQIRNAPRRKNRIFGRRGRGRSHHFHTLQPVMPKVYLLLCSIERIDKAKCTLARRR